MEFRVIRVFRESNPTVFSFALAIVFAIFGYFFMRTGFGVYEPPDNSIYMRTAYLCAFFLLMQDVLEAGDFAISKNPTIESPHFWIGAFHMGYFWAVGMIIVNWSGMEDAPRQLLTFGISGLFFGLITTSVRIWRPPHRVHDNFDIENGMTRSPIPKALYFLWPIITVPMIAGLLASPPTKGWDEGYFLFQLIFFGTLLPLYPPNTGGLKMFGSGVGWPRLVGSIILMGALLLR